MANAARKRNHARYSRAEYLRPTSITELRQCVEPGVQVPFALRPQGGRTASTACNSSPGGLVIDMSGLSRIIEIDAERRIVTVEAGVRLQDVVAVLDQNDLELPGCYDLYRHTVGGAVAAPCFGAGVGEDAASLSRQIISMKVVAPSGALVTVAADDQKFMPLFRASYGLLGIIAEVCFRVRPKQIFSRKFRKLDHDQLLNGLDSLAELPIGLKFYLLPHRDRAYLELIRSTADAKNINGAAWKAKDWGETVVLPRLCNSLGRVIPMQSIRYRLIDSVSGLAQDMAQSRLFETGSYSTAAGHRQSGNASSTPFYSTWLFSAARARSVVADYIRFCQDIFASTGYRCDLPAMGFRVAKDASAWLSPSRTRNMVAIQTSTTRESGWEDFVIDLADFAEKHGGVPVFNQTRAVTASYAERIYGDALRTFVSVRRQLDTDNRLLNPFFAQYFR